MQYVKCHGLGNDYLVIPPSDVVGTIETRRVQRTRVCEGRMNPEISEEGR